MRWAADKKRTGLSHGGMPSSPELGPVQHVSVQVPVRKGLGSNSLQTILFVLALVAWSSPELPRERLPLRARSQQFELLLLLFLRARCL